MQVTTVAAIALVNVADPNVRPGDVFLDTSTGTMFVVVLTGAVKSFVAVVDALTLSGSIGVTVTQGVPASGILNVTGTVTDAGGAPMVGVALLVAVNASGAGLVLVDPGAVAGQVTNIIDGAGAEAMAMVVTGLLGAWALRATVAPADTIAGNVASLGGPILGSQTFAGTGP